MPAQSTPATWSRETSHTALFGLGHYNKISQMGWLKQEKCIFSQFWMWGSPQSSSWPILLWGDGTFLQCPHIKRESKSSPDFPLTETLILPDQGPTLRTSFNPNYLLIALSPIQSHSVYEHWEDTIRPMAYVCKLQCPPATLSTIPLATYQGHHDCYGW